MVLVEVEVHEVEGADGGVVASAQRDPMTGDVVLQFSTNAGARALRVSEKIAKGIATAIGRAVHRPGGAS